MIFIPNMASQTEFQFQVNKVTIESSETINSRFSKYLNNPVLSDVTIKVGNDSKTIYAHKVILSSSSDYFQAMFANKYQEDTQIVFSETEQVVMALLTFIYTGKVEVEADILLKLLEFSHRCLMNELVGV